MSHQRRNFSFLPWSRRCPYSLSSCTCCQVGGRLRNGDFLRMSMILAIVGAGTSRFSGPVGTKPAMTSGGSSCGGGGGGGGGMGGGPIDGGPPMPGKGRGGGGSPPPGI